VPRGEQKKGRKRASSSQSSDVTRRTEILDTAAHLFGTSGFQVSLNDVADACGIKAGSLYHHFDSKEAIVVELVERYQLALDSVANNALDNLRQDKTKSVFEHIAALASAIVSCAGSHRAALLQTFYDPPASASKAFVRLAKRTSASIEAAMLEILRSGSKTGYIKQGINLALLAEYICQRMLNSSVGSFHRAPGAEKMPELKCRVMLDGLVVKPPANEKLSKSKAFLAAQKSIARWQQAEQRNDDKAAELWIAARREFGRRGYEATTIRDIAAAADMSTGAVYRLVASKEELLVSIMTTFISHVNDGWNAIMDSKSTPVEKLDALLWFNINVLSHFSDEFKIQLAWLRQTPPPQSFGEYTDVVKQIKSVMAEGEQNGSLKNLGASADVRALSLLELVWVPEQTVRNAGVEGAHALARETILRGVTI